MSTSWSLTGKVNPHSPVVGGGDSNDAWKQSLPLYVLHVDDEIIHWVTGDGLLHSVPPGEVYEFTNRFHGRKFLEHKWMHGPVEVEIVRTTRGIELKVDAAAANAKAALAEAEHKYIEGYIETQTADRLGTGHPAMKPSARQQRKIKKHQINLQDYGIVPVGTRSSMETQMEAVLEQNRLMMGILVALHEGKSIQSAAVAGLGRTIKATTPAASNARPFDQTPSPIREDLVDNISGDDGEIQVQVPSRIPSPDQVSPELIEKPIVEYGDPDAELPTTGIFHGDVADANQVSGPSASLNVAPRTPRGRSRG